jgi:hypothetical protein
VAAKLVELKDSSWWKTGGARWPAALTDARAGRRRDALALMLPTPATAARLFMSITPNDDMRPAPVSVARKSIFWARLTLDRRPAPENAAVPWGRPGTNRSISAASRPRPVMAARAVMA